MICMVIVIILKVIKTKSANKLGAMHTQLLAHLLRRFRLNPMVARKLYQCQSSFSIRCRSPLVHGQKLGTKLGGNCLLAAGILSMFSKDEETPEDRLGANIKWSILYIQRGQYEKAEQMLHLTLRMAQDLQNKDAITYVFDVMANLAMEQGEFKKAEKLFVTVMQRLLGDGYAQDDIKMLHISTKIAEIKFQSGDLTSAEQGFKWAIEKLDQKMVELKDDLELLELWGITKDNYAQLLMQQGKFDEAKICLSQAFDVLCQIHGKNHPEVATLLNNLAVVCTSTNDLVQAEGYPTEALELAKQFPELHDSGIFQANRGLLFIKQGLLDEVKKICVFAWRSAKKTESDDGIQQADYCLKQLKELGV